MVRHLRAAWKVRLPLIGYLILSVMMVVGLYRVETLAHRLNNQTRTDCVDRDGDKAFRNQDQAVINLYRALQTGIVQQKDAADIFIKTYMDALKEAGPVPKCIATP